MSVDKDTVRRIAKLARLAVPESRLEPMTAVTLKNREHGPELALQIAEDRAPDGFKNVEDVISREEMAAITENYKRAAGFDSNSVNTRPSYLQKS